MSQFASPRKALRANRPLAVTTACALLIVLAILAAACDFGPTPTPVTQNTPPPATSVPAATETVLPAVASPTATSVPSDTPTQTETATPTPSPTETEVPIPAFTWKEVGLAKTYLRDMALLAGGNNIVLVASSDGLWRSSYDYTNWEKLKAPASGNPPPATLGLR